VLWAAMTLSLVISSKDKGPTDAIYKIELWIWVAASLYFAWISLWRTFVKGDPDHGQEAH
jgi:phosphatidylcholine synthase